MAPLRRCQLILHVTLLIELLPRLSSNFDEIYRIGLDYIVLYILKIKALALKVLL